MKRNPNITRFQLMRIQAVDAYGEIEVELSIILELLLRSPVVEAGSIIFYRITNTRTRYSIIEAFIKNVAPDYRNPWNVIAKWMSRLDVTRNGLVHWGLSYGEKHKEGRYRTTDIHLANPKSFSQERQPESTIELKKIEEFLYDCSTIHEILRLFGVCFLEDDETIPPEPMHLAWRKIFLQLKGNQTPAEFLQRLNDARL